VTERALEGIRVLDLSEWVAGPYCGRLLAGFGADVLKVERPGAGDCARRAGPFPSDVPNPEASGLFLYLNTGKRGITLDWSSPTGRELLRRLAAEADVVIESAGPEAMAALGFDDAGRERDFSSLILASVSDFGWTGPYAGYRGTEAVVLALSGLMSVTGNPEREPLKNGGYLASYGCGQYAFTATLAALFGDTGEHIETSVLDNAITITEVYPQMTAATGELRRRMGNLAGPGWGLYPCADGWVSVAIEFRRDLARVAAALGIPELDDPKFDDYAWGYTQHADEMEALLLGWLLPRTRREIYDVAQANHLAWGYVAFPEEMLADEQLQAREFFDAIEHPVAGRLPYPGPPFRMSETPWSTTRAPLLGEHNVEVFDRLGVSKDELMMLRASGVV
jgi:crotonobetainyl-CoA:carnitine CoA-transferase CaiB-like acyl-CoA transferase